MSVLWLQILISFEKTVLSTLVRTLLSASAIQQWSGFSSGVTYPVIGVPKCYVWIQRVCDSLQAQTPKGRALQHAKKSMFFFFKWKDSKDKILKWCWKVYNKECKRVSPLLCLWLSSTHRGVHVGDFPWHHMHLPLCGEWARVGVGSLPWGRLPLWQWENS